MNTHNQKEQPQEIPQIELRPHQIKALKVIENNKIGILRLYCGTGKTLIIRELTNKHKRILIVVPAIMLVVQLLEVLKTLGDKELRKNLIYFCTGSPFSRDRNDPKFIMRMQESEKLIIISTYESFRILFGSNNSIFNNIRLNMVIFDESHHLSTPVFLPRSERTIFLSATPNMFTENKKIPKIPLLLDYGYSSAYKDGFAVNYKMIFSMYVPPPIRRNNAGKPHQTAETLEAIQFKIISKIANMLSKKRVLIYNRSIEPIEDAPGSTSSQGFLNINTENPPNNQINIKHIDATQPEKEREETLEWLCATYNKKPSQPAENPPDTRYLCNVNTVREGIDLDCVDMIVFCDEKHSSAEIIESIGRGTRLYEENEKKELCILVLHPEEPHIQMFKKVINILVDLKDLDSRVTEKVLKEITSSIKPHHTGILVDFKNNPAYRLF